MQFNFVRSVNPESLSGQQRVGKRAPSRPAQNELTNADYDRMSRAARAVSNSNGFMEAFKKANPDWKPDFSKLG